MSFAENPGVEPLVGVPFHAGEAAAPVSRPTNIARSLFHVASGFVALALIRVLPGRAWLVAAAGAFAVFAWTAELLRRRDPAVNGKLMRFFGPVAHAHERHQTNSSTWYITALLLMAIFAPMQAAELAVLVLGLADPAAGVIGRRFGRTRIRRGRSLEGTLAFVVTGFVASFAWLALAGGDGAHRVLLAAVAAVTGAVAELVAGERIDDNFAIPMSIAATVTLALALV